MIYDAGNNSRTTVTKASAEVVRVLLFLAMAASSSSYSCAATTPSVAFQPSASLLHPRKIGIVSSSQKHHATSTSSSEMIAATTVETTATAAAKDLPYVVRRGDGSTGGGGLPMPRSDDNMEDGRSRPKVGAEMPKGRPSWFKVPAPSQGR
jgi:hypothetical protein